MRVNIALLNDSQMVMGELEKANSTELFIRAAFPWAISDEVSVRISIDADGEWLQGRLTVRDVFEMVENHTPLARCSISSMSPSHRQRLLEWLDVSRSSSTLWAETASLCSAPNTQQRQKFRSVLLQRVRRLQSLRSQS
jgi:hypothetical protein